MKKAVFLDKTGNRSGAIDLLNDLSEQYPNSFDIMMAKGDMLRQNSDFAEAIKTYSDILQLRSDKVTADDWVLYYVRGICYDQVDNWESAELDFKKALKLQPNQADILNYLGYSWLTKNKNIEKAKQMLEMAVAERPEDAHIIDSLGWAYYLSGDYKKITGIYRASD